MSDEERENKKQDPLINSEESSTKVPDLYRDGNNPNIIREVYRVGIKVFLIFSIFPALFTILYLIIILPGEIKTNTFEFFGSGSTLFPIILIWLIVILGLSIPAMIGKRFLYTEKKKRIFLMPVMTFVICVIFGIIWIFTW